MLRFLIIIPLFFYASTTTANDIAELQDLVSQENYVKALILGEDMLKQNPEDVNTRFLLAYSNQMTERHDRAIELYEGLIRDYPELPEPRNNLAMIYLADGNYDRATELLVSALNTHSTYATVYANLGEVYSAIASEAYRRAVSESAEPANYTHVIDVAAIDSLDSLDRIDAPLPAGNETVAATAAVSATPETTEPASVQATSTIDESDTQALLIANVHRWADDWSNKNFAGYTAWYVEDYRAKFDSHADWVAYRRQRILRPGEIRVEVSNFRIRPRDAARVSVDFEQAFRSPGYRDRVVKRLDFQRIDSQWKIVSERVLSVL